MTTAPATASKPAAKPAAKPAKKPSQGFTGIKSGFSVIIGCFVVALAVYLLVFGSLSNFEGGNQYSCVFSIFLPGDITLEPANIMGTVYKGGFIVPLIWTQLFTVIALAIERLLALRTAFGKSSMTAFVAEVKKALISHDLSKAEQLCDAQRGSVANVVKSTLKKYHEMELSEVLTKEQKIIAIQKELEEATALEIPMLQENLPIIGTIVSLGTLTGLLGTVIGMIRSFSAMATGEGGADSSALSTGISEALVNTASGIATGACATIAYNYFTNKIDRLTFSIDEVGFTIVQTYNATH